MKKSLKILLWIVIGFTVGILTGYLRAFSPRSFWCFCDLAGRYGFWIFTVSLIAYLSTDKKAAGLHCFLYMFCMCIAYYGYLYYVKGFLYIKQFILWGIFSVIAAIYAMLIREAREHRRKIDFIICIIPFSLLAIEFVNMLYYFTRYRTNFFQLIVDFAGIIVLGTLFGKRRQVNK